MSEGDAAAEQQLSVEFWMLEYKVTQCKRKYPHDWAACPCAHKGERAARRDPTRHAYSAALACPRAKLRQPCPAGDGCPHAHNLFEYWLHPQRFKTELCSQGIKCDRPVCFFAHDVEELRPLDPALPPAETCWSTGATLVGRRSQAQLQHQLQHAMQLQEQSQAQLQLQLQLQEQVQAQLQLPAQAQAQAQQCVPLSAPCVLQQVRGPMHFVQVQPQPLLVQQQGALGALGCALSAGMPSASFNWQLPMQQQQPPQQESSGLPIAVLWPPGQACEQQPSSRLGAAASCTYVPLSAAPTLPPVTLGLAAPAPNGSGLTAAGSPLFVLQPQHAAVLQPSGLPPSAQAGQLPLLNSCSTAVPAGVLSSATSSSSNASTSSQEAAPGTLFF